MNANKVAFKLSSKIFLFTSLLFVLVATSVVMAEIKKEPVPSDDMVTCMALHCPQLPGIQPQPAMPSIDSMERIIAVKKRIVELHQELENLHKELADLHASLPKVPEPPIVIQPMPENNQREQLLHAIKKWSTLLYDPNTSEEDRKRATEEIAMLKQSLAKLDTTISDQPKPPLPCLGAYIDASGQLRNACGDHNFKPLPGPKDDVSCMALGCPKPPQPVKPQPVSPETAKPTQSVKLAPGNPEPGKLAQPVRPQPVKPETAKPVQPVKPAPVKPEPGKPVQPVRPQPVKPETAKPTQTVKPTQSTKPVQNTAKK